MKYRLFIMMMLALSLKLSAQKINVRDSMISASFLHFAYTLQSPGGDLSERFGLNSAIGAGYFRKTKKNFVFGADLNYIFGNNVKEDSILNPISTDRGFVLSREGEYTDVRLYERGFHFNFKGGKVFPVFAPNKNSGIMLTAGAGFLQHKIRIETAGNNTPQLSPAYRKGYDRLSNGFALTGTLGYLYLDNRKRFNFYLGAEITSAYTESRRDYNFDSMMKDTKKRKDLLTGFKASFIIPLYPRAPKDFYFN